MARPRRATRIQSAWTTFTDISRLDGIKAIGVERHHDVRRTPQLAALRSLRCAAPTNSNQDCRDQGCRIRSADVRAIRTGAASGLPYRKSGGETMKRFAVISAALMLAGGVTIAVINSASAASRTRPRRTPRSRCPGRTISATATRTSPATSTPSRHRLRPLPHRRRSRTRQRRRRHRRWRRPRFMPTERMDTPERGRHLDGSATRGSSDHRRVMRAYSTRHHATPGTAWAVRLGLSPSR